MILTSPVAQTFSFKPSISFAHSTLELTPTQIFVIHIANMRSCIKIAVLVLATFIVPQVLSAPTRYGSPSLLVKFKGWAFLIS